MTASAPLVTVRGVVKQYQALRPLRVAALTVAPGQVVAVTGLDAAAAEMLIGLLTGAVLPDDGEVELFGRSTRALGDSEAWLRLLDGVGIVTDRAVLIAQFSVEQNLAMPFTLDIDPVADPVRGRVRALAAEVGLDESVLAAPVAEAGSDVQARVRLARALALDPSLLLAEHPSATLPRPSVGSYAADLGRLARARGLAVLAVTADETFARALGGDVWRHDPATGALAAPGLWRKLFG